MRPELLKGHLDALLLAVLEPGPQHGYAVIEALRAGSDGALELPTGTVYPALHRLERAGLIASDWQTVGGRRRRAYHLTPRSEEHTSELQSRRDLVCRLLLEKKKKKRTRTVAQTQLHTTHTHQ